MKIRFHQILPAFSIIISANIVFAQEGLNVGPGMETNNGDRELIISAPGETDGRTYNRSYTVTTLKDSASSNQTTITPISPGGSAQKIKAEKLIPQKPPKAPLDKTGKPDDSILSFNFLYYIIEKYKLQDIVD